MDTAELTILATLIAYKLLLLGIGFWAQARNRDESDFFLGGRKLGPLVAAISASASSSSVWTLLGVSGYAYLQGVSAIWFLPGCIGGFALNWYVVAPRLQRQGREALTLTEFLAGPVGTPGRRAVMVTGSVILLLCLVTYVSAQLQGAGTTFETTFGFDGPTSILIGGAIVLTYTLLGGFWAVSITDTLQGLMMAGAAVLLPVVALIHVGGPDGLGEAVGADPTIPDRWLDTLGDRGLGAGAGFVLGILGIGLGYPGQPHVVNRFMALDETRSLRRARNYAMGWALLVYSGMVILGLCARTMGLGLDEGAHEGALFAATEALFHPVVSGLILAAVLSAIMSTADSQLLVAGSTVSHDLASGSGLGSNTLGNSRLTVGALCIGAVGLALFVDKTIFEAVLSAWAVLGATFGPLLLVRLLRGPVRHPFSLVAMLIGAVGTVGAYSALGSSTDPLVNVAPWSAAGLAAWIGTSRPAAA